MKISQAQYDDLKESILTIVNHAKFIVTDETHVSVLWSLFHEVNAQKTYGYDHPRWQNIPRILYPSHIHGRGYIGELYESGLMDSHIETALKKIAKEISKK